MGCNSGKASPPGAQTGKPEDAKPLLLGSEDPAAPVKASPDMRASTDVSMKTFPAPGSPRPAPGLQTEGTDTSAGDGTPPNQIQVDTPTTLPSGADPSPASPAAHFSPLSIVGVWYYDGKRQGTKYEISIYEDSLQIEQVVHNELHRGLLSADGEWLVGSVKKLNGELTGTIRIQHQAGKLLSNFKVPGGEWGVDLLATKAPSLNLSSVSPGAVSPSAPKQQLADNEEDRLRLAMESLPKSPDKNQQAPPRDFPASTAEDVRRAGEQAVARAKAGANSSKCQEIATPSDAQPTMCPVRREKQLCCC